MSELNDDQKRLADALEDLKEHNFIVWVEEDDIYAIR